MMAKSDSSDEINKSAEYRYDVEEKKYDSNGGYLINDYSSLDAGVKSLKMQENERSSEDDESLRSAFSVPVSLFNREKLSLGKPLELSDNTCYIKRKSSVDSSSIHFVEKKRFLESDDQNVDLLKRKYSKNDESSCSSYLADKQPMAQKRKIEESSSDQFSEDDEQTLFANGVSREILDKGCLNKVTDCIDSFVSCGKGIFDCVTSPISVFCEIFSYDQRVDGVGNTYDDYEY